MDPNLQPGPVMDAFREQIRAVLRVRGFNFCDEGDGSPESNARAVADMRAAAGSVEGRDEVIAAGIEASTVDHQDQCIDNTLAQNEDFWSSTGNPDPESSESLLYRLAPPLCALHSVTIGVYRARYQFGEPIYPSTEVSFEVGASPDALHQCGGRFKVLATDELQTFVLPANAAVGRFLRVCLHGKVQRQLEDLNFYAAMRYVTAHGTAVPASAVASFVAELRSRPLQLPLGSYLPGSLLANSSGSSSNSPTGSPRAKRSRTLPRGLPERPDSPGDVTRRGLTRRLANFLGISSPQRSMTSSPTPEAAQQASSGRPAGSAPGAHSRATAWGRDGAPSRAGSIGLERRASAGTGMQDTGGGPGHEAPNSSGLSPQSGPEPSKRRSRKEALSSGKSARRVPSLGPMPGARPAEEPLFIWS